MGQVTILKEFNAVPDPDAPGKFMVKGVPFLPLTKANREKLKKLNGVDHDDEWANDFVNNFNDMQGEDGFLHRAHLEHNEKGKPSKPTLWKVANMQLRDRVMKNGETAPTLHLDWVRITQDKLDDINAGRLNTNRSMEYWAGKRRFRSLAVGDIDPAPFAKLAPVDLADGEPDEELCTLPYSKLEDVVDTGIDADPDLDDGKGGDKPPEPGKDDDMTGEAVQALKDVIKDRDEKITSLQEDVTKAADDKKSTDERLTKLEEESKEKDEALKKVMDENDKLSTENFDESVTSLFDGAVAKGRIAPAEVEGMKAFCYEGEGDEKKPNKAGFKNTKKILEAREDGSVVKLSEIVKDGKDEDDDKGKSKKKLKPEEVIKLADKMVKEEKATSLTEAIHEIKSTHDVEDKEEMIEIG